MDRQDGLASHFAFVGCDHPFQAPQVKRLELLVPHMHAAIFRLENRAPCASGPLNRSIRLTRAEREIIRWICLGKTNAEIAIITERSIRTVNNQVAGMLSKLSFSNRVQLVVWALRSGCVEDL
jgi:DNA-binding CsgD family transcriptional regulator